MYRFWLEPAVLRDIMHENVQVLFIYKVIPSLTIQVVHNGSRTCSLLLLLIQSMK